MAPTRVMALSSVIGLVLAGCAGPAFADRPVKNRAVTGPVTTVESPYDLSLVDSSGRTVSTYQHRGRFYVLGSAGERYTLVVTNPTPRRIEAVVSVDGLDVIDGGDADFAHKRGYVVPPHGELRIDGYRVSTEQVATFRFSSVSRSYAGRKGKARNVGVIGLAIFEEKDQPQVIVPQRPVYPRPAHPGDDDREEFSHGTSDGRGYGGGTAPPPRPRSSGKAASDSAEAAPSEQPSGSNGGSSVSRRAPKRDHSSEDRSGRYCCKEKSRPGLGTEFGESRYSAVSWTRFERRHPTRPDVMAELRYNDTDGLRALGIDLGDRPDPGEIYVRETATPWPHSGFATPPR